MSWVSPSSSNNRHFTTCNYNDDLFLQVTNFSTPQGGLLGLCHWMRSHFHDWTDYNEVSFQAFLIELLEWGRTFLGL